MPDSYTIDTLFDPTSQYYNGAPSFGLPPSAQNAFTDSVGSLSIASGDISGKLTLQKDASIQSGQTDYNTGTGLWLGDDGGTRKFSLGDSTTNYMTWDGSELLFTGKTRQTLKFSTVFETGTRFTQTKSAPASITFGDFGVALATSATANSYARLEMDTSNAASLGGFKPFKQSAFSILCNISDRGTVSGFAGVAYVGIWNQGSTANGTTLQLDVRDQYGFKIIKTSGAVTLYATSTNTDNNVEEVTEIQQIAEAEAMFLAANVTTGKVSFYADVDGATTTVVHTTQVPKIVTSEEMCGFFFINNSNTADNWELELNSYTFEKFSVGVY